HELLDAFGALTGPGRDDGDLADRNVGVLPLRHRTVRPDTPANHADEEHPRDLAVLDKESSDAEAMPLSRDVAAHVILLACERATGFPSHDHPGATDWPRRRRSFAPQSTRPERRRGFLPEGLD